MEGWSSKVVLCKSYAFQGSIVPIGTEIPSAKFGGLYRNGKQVVRMRHTLENPNPLFLLSQISLFSEINGTSSHI